MLINAFTARALRDAFAPARSAGLFFLFLSGLELYCSFTLGRKDDVLLQVDPYKFLVMNGFASPEENFATRTVFLSYIRCF